jgi:hypothetical protein
VDIPKTASRVIFAMGRGLMIGYSAIRAWGYRARTEGHPANDEIALEPKNN